MLVYKPQQHLNQQIGLDYLTNFEMTHLKFSRTSQRHKTTILRIAFKKKKANWPDLSSNQSMSDHVN